MSTRVAPDGSADLLSRIAGPAFVLGGLIVVADYGLDIAVGMATGQSAGSPQTSTASRISSTLVAPRSSAMGSGWSASRVTSPAHPSLSSP